MRHLSLILLLLLCTVSASAQAPPVWHLASDFSQLTLFTTQGDTLVVGGYPDFFNTFISSARLAPDTFVTFHFGETGIDLLRISPAGIQPILDTPLPFQVLPTARYGDFLLIQEIDSPPLSRGLVLNTVTNELHFLNDRLDSLNFAHHIAFAGDTVRYFGRETLTLWEYDLSTGEATALLRHNGVPKVYHTADGATWWLVYPDEVVVVGDDPNEVKSLLETREYAIFNDFVVVTEAGCVTACSLQLVPFDGTPPQTYHLPEQREPPLVKYIYPDGRLLVAAPAVFLLGPNNQALGGEFFGFQRDYVSDDGRWVAVVDNTLLKVWDMQAQRIVFEREVSLEHTAVQAQAESVFIQTVAEKRTAYLVHNGQLITLPILENGYYMGLLSDGTLIASQHPHLYRFDVATQAFTLLVPNAHSIVSSWGVQ